MRTALRLIQHFVLSTSFLAFLEAHVDNEMTETNFVAIAQDARLVRDQALPVEIGSVAAVLIDQTQCPSVPADNGGVTPRNAFVNRLAIGEIDDRRFPVIRV